MVETMAILPTFWRTSNSSCDALKFANEAACTPPTNSTSLWARWPALRAQLAALAARVQGYEHKLRWLALSAEHLAVQVTILICLWRLNTLDLIIDRLGISPARLVSFVRSAHAILPRDVWSVILSFV